MSAPDITSRMYISNLATRSSASSILLRLFLLRGRSPGPVTPHHSPSAFTFPATSHASVHKALFQHDLLPRNPSLFPSQGKISLFPLQIFHSWYAYISTNFIWWHCGRCSKYLNPISSSSSESGLMSFLASLAKT